jgi:hypothetical protein
MPRSTDRSRQRVVVHFKGGRLLKGFTSDFIPGKDTFSVTSEYQRDRGRTYLVNVKDLKALFFVKVLDGNIFYREKKKFREVNMSHLRGLSIEIRFKDGETVRGSTLDYAVGKETFFVTPVDPDSNNELIYVVSDAISELKVAGEAVESASEPVGATT